MFLYNHYTRGKIKCKVIIMVDHILRTSLEQGITITIMYTKDNIITKRNIQVQEIGDTCIKAYCYLRRQNRVFKRENILAADYIREKARY